MEKNLIYSAGATAAVRYAASCLSDLGLPIATAPDIQTRYLLLDTPAFESGGQLRSGEPVDKLLHSLPRDILICGGNLRHPELDGYETVDFLQDETYLCENAYITAECALDVALPYLKHTIRNLPVLIIGWGRIGKCLAQILRSLEADVTVAARNPKDRAALHSLGFDALDFESLPFSLSHFRLLYNTVPHPVLNREQMRCCRTDCIKIELASSDGIMDEDVIVARGLPGIHMPESSGKLIADTFIRLCKGR